MKNLTFLDLRLDKKHLTNIVEAGGLREKVEVTRLAYLKSNKKKDAIAFSQAVFAWGRGDRVYGKLSKEKWHTHVHQWLQKVPKLSEREAIEQGIELSGIGVSFASKHLRLLYPDRFATLDSVIDDRLGYSRNPAGYLRFLSDLKAFKDKYRLQYDIGDLEEAIFKAIKEERNLMKMASRI